MPKKIMYARSNVENDLKKVIYCKDLDKDEYESKYKGKLTCIKGCKARIKYTERKDNVKFFSTWNKEGNLHDKGCPYHVNYIGKVGRKELEAFYKNVELSEEVIMRRLKDKMERLLREHSELDIIHPINGSKSVENMGKTYAEVYVADENGEVNEHMKNLRYDDAEYVTIDDIGTTKAVHGHIDNVQLVKEKDKGEYAYFNLVTSQCTVNIAFPEAFYSNEFSTGVEEFELFIDAVKEKVQNKPKQIWVIAYGDITKKKRDKNGVNISVISPNRILVDNKTYKEIIYKK